MKRIVSLTESDLTRIVRRVIKEQDEKLIKLRKEIYKIEKTGIGNIDISVTNQNAQISITDKNGQTFDENVLISDFPLIFNISINPTSYGPGDNRELNKKMRNHFLSLMKEGKTINISINAGKATFTFPGGSGKIYTETISPLFLAYVFSLK